MHSVSKPRDERAETYSDSRVVTEPRLAFLTVVVYTYLVVFQPGAFDIIWHKQHSVSKPLEERVETYADSNGLIDPKLALLSVLVYTYLVEFQPGSFDIVWHMKHSVNKLREEREEIYSDFGASVSVPQFKQSLVVLKTGAFNRIRHKKHVVSKLWEERAEIQSDFGITIDPSLAFFCVSVYIVPDAAVI